MPRPASSSGTSVWTKMILCGANLYSMKLSLPSTSDSKRDSVSLLRICIRPNSQEQCHRDRIRTMRHLTAAATILLLAACASQPQPQRQPQPTAASGRSGSISATGFDVANLDRTANACDDFYRFADGGWMKSHPIPPAYPTWGNFSVLLVSNQEKMHTILEEAAKSNAPAGSDEQKVGAYYASCMNEKAIERTGITPLTPDFSRIAALRSVSNLPNTLAHLHSYRIAAVFAFSSTQDYKQTEQTVASISQAGLGLPDRDYYT